MTILGLTGGVGMGKSLAAEFLQQRGVPVVDTDQLAREAAEPGQPALDEIRREFGDEIVDAEGRLRRDELARRVFADAARRRRLEAILHPRIRARWRTAVAQWGEQGHRLGVVVIPLLFETRAEAELDAVLCVACSAATQRARLQARGWSDVEAEQRNRAQWPIEQKMAQSRYVVWNEGDRAVLREQLDRVLQRIARA